MLLLIKCNKYVINVSPCSQTHVHDIVFLKESLPEFSATHAFNEIKQDNLDLDTGDFKCPISKA